MIARMVLHAWMKSVDKSPEALAGEIGVHPSAVRRWMRGDRMPRAHQLARLTLISAGQVTANDFVAYRELRKHHTPQVA